MNSCNFQIFTNRFRKPISRCEKLTNGVRLSTAADGVSKAGKAVQWDITSAVSGQMWSLPRSATARPPSQRGSIVASLARAATPQKYIYPNAPPYNIERTPLHSLYRPLSTMGVLADIAGPLGRFTSDSSLPVLVAAGFASFILLAIVLNVLKQLLLKNPNEPPLVFHWLPVIGSTVTYGIDPYKFFFANQKKV